MSWESHYHPPAEAMEKYKPWKFDDKFYKDETSEHTRDAKLGLLIYCLEDHSEESTHKIIQDVSFHLRYLAASIQEEEKAFAYKRWKEESGDLWYSGRSFENAIEPIDEIVSNEIEMFLIMAKIVKTDDYFKDNSTFYDKREDLKERIDYFSERISDRVIHEITQDLQEFYEDPYKSLKEELNN